MTTLDRLKQGDEWPCPLCHRPICMRHQEGPAKGNILPHHEHGTGRACEGAGFNPFEKPFPQYERLVGRERAVQLMRNSLGDPSWLPPEERTSESGPASIQPLGEKAEQMYYSGVSEDVANRMALLMVAVGEDRWAELEARLAAGTMRELDPELNLARLSRDQVEQVMGAAQEVYDHDRNIVTRRQELHECITEAQVQTLRALSLMKDLDELGDVEYEGGHADTERFLKDAGRSLRAAQALKPTDKNGS